jgi:hypothetical protein
MWYPVGGWEGSRTIQNILKKVFAPDRNWTIPVIQPVA